MPEFLQAQEILRRCFNNVTDTIKAGTMGSAQDYFNAVYDETDDSLRVSFGQEAGVLYWGKPVANVPSLPPTGREGEVRLVFVDDFGKTSLYFYELGSWHKFDNGDIEVQDEGNTVEIATKIINFIGADVKVLNTGGGKVDVYIPSVAFVSHYNTTDGSNNCLVSQPTWYNRHIATPTSEGSPYKIGTSLGGDILETTNVGSLPFTISNTCSFVDNTTTTIEANVYDADGVTVLATHTTSAITGNIDVTVNNIRIQVSSFGIDLTKYRGIIDVTVDIDTILPSGGKFSIEIIHHNGSEGDFSFTKNNLFSDTETFSATLTGVDVVENLAALTPKSGVYHYAFGSIFDSSISVIDYINSNSYPTDFIQLEYVTMGISGAYLSSTDLTDWTSAYTNIGASYSETGITIDILNYFSRLTSSKLRARSIDWANGSWVDSPNKSMLVDTYVDNSTRIYEDFTSEAYRLESDLATSWDGTQSLLSYNGGNGLLVGEGTYLQYPRINYTIYEPNIGSQPSYVTATGTRYYYRRMWHTNVSHSNGIFNILGVTEGDLTANDVKIEISLDGIAWYNCNADYVGGALSNGDGCRINTDTVIIPNLQFTLGTGGFTDASTGGGWGIYIRISMPDTSTVEMDLIQITNWV